MAFNHLMLKESAMKKWFKFEMGKINSGIVTKKMALFELAKLKSPQTLTKDGSTYYFNCKVIDELARTLPEKLQTIKLPVSIYASLDVRGSVYIAELPSLQLLKQLKEIPQNAELMDGKYWIGKTIAMDIMRRYPTMIQFVRY
jgi:uncharacterized protein (UPF0216 family)